MFGLLCSLLRWIVLVHCHPMPNLKSAWGGIFFLSNHQSSKQFFKNIFSTSPFFCSVFLGHFVKAAGGLLMPKSVMYTFWGPTFL